MNNLEEWKTIEEFPDYQVSNLGRIKSLKWNKIKILVFVNTKKGYNSVNLCKNSKQKNMQVHKLVYEAFVEKLNKEECLHHLNKNKKDNRLDNLIKMTMINHSIEHNKGEKSHYHKLSKEDVIKIKQMLKEDKHFKSIIAKNIM